MLGRVLILSASAGAGHLRAAQAIEIALAEAGGAEEVRNVDTLDYTNPVFRNLYSKAYIEMVNKTPELLGWLYDHLDKPWKHRPEARVREAEHAPVREAPEVVPARHRDLHAPAAGGDHLVAEVEGEARDPAGDRRHRLRRARDVALPPLRALLRRDRGDPRPPGVAGRAGLEDHRSGIPIDPAFARPKDKAEMRGSTA